MLRANVFCLIQLCGIEEGTPRCVTLSWYEDDQHPCFCVSCTLILFDISRDVMHAPRHTHHQPLFFNSIQMRDNSVIYILILWLWCPYAHFAAGKLTFFSVALLTPWLFLFFRFWLHTNPVNPHFELTCSVLIKLKASHRPLTDLPLHSPPSTHGHAQLPWRRRPLSGDARRWERTRPLSEGQREPRGQTPWEDVAGIALCCAAD